MKEFPPFRLDTADECLWHRTGSQDQRVSLTPKAFAVLRYLVEHAGRVITQDELLTALWPDTFVQPEVLKYQIAGIRRTLGDHPRNPLFIETLPRRGYRFVAAVTDGERTESAAPMSRAGARLVGRARELGELRACLEHALNGQRQIVFITGEPGIGKTALVDEFQRIAAAEEPSILIARGQCVESCGGAEPYYPMLDALGALCRGREGNRMVEILAAQAATWLVQFPSLLSREQRNRLQQEIAGATRDRMLREIGDALDTLDLETPLLLVFEDLQWVDPSTVSLISALARRLMTAKIMIIMTARPVDMAAPDHPLKALKQDLLIHDLCSELVLAPLSEADVAEYLRAESQGGSLPQGFAGLIHHHSDGNPLFMVAFLDHMMEHGLISRENGTWRLKVPLEEAGADVPDTLRQMIEAQIDHLTAEQQRALEIASVAGSPFPVSVVAAAMKTDTEFLDELFARLSRRSHMVRVVGAQRLADGGISQIFDFVHALYREVLYRRQTPGRRANLHRRIAELTEAQSARPNEAAPLLAHHFEEGGDWRRAIHYLRFAAETAAERLAPEEAAAILQHALGLLSQLPEAERAPIESRILDQLATMYRVSSELRTVESSDAPSGRTSYYPLIDIEARAFIDLAYPFSRVDAGPYVEILDRFLRLSEEQTDPLIRTRMRASCFLLRIWALGWDPLGAEVCRQALEEVRRAGDPVVLGAYSMGYGLIQLVSSAYREALRTVTEGRDLLGNGPQGNPFFGFAYRSSQFTEAWSLHFLGEWGAALKHIEATIALLDRSGDHYREYAMRLYKAWVHLFAQDFHAVLSLCDSTTVSTGDSRGIHPRRFSLLKGCAELGLGNYDRARGHLLAAQADMDARTVMFDWYLRLPLEWGLTELSLSTGKPAQTRIQAERFVEAASATAEHTWQALAWETNARVAIAERDLDRAHDCITKALSAMEGFETPLAAWRVHATASDLCGSRGNLAQAEHHRELSRATILKLADSLAPDDPLRNRFLTSPQVSRVLSDPETKASPAIHGQK